MVLLESGETGEYVEVQKQNTQARRLLALASLAILIAGIFPVTSAQAQAPAGWVQVGWVYPQQVQPVQLVPLVPVVQQPPPQIIVWEPPQWRNQGGVLVWDGYWRQQTANLVQNQPAPPAKDPNAMGKIKRYPKYKDFGDGVRGELIDEDGNEERVTRHTGTNRGRYRLSKYIPGHRDSYGDWIPGHREELGDSEEGQDLDEERGERRDWSYRKR